jgi:hypothetical protein
MNSDTMAHPSDHDEQEQQELKQRRIAKPIALGRRQ